VAESDEFVKIFYIYTLQLKGTVAQYFPPPFFSSKVPTLDSDSYPSFFKFDLKFVELSELKFDSPLHDAAGSQKSLLHDATGSQSRRYILQRGVKTSHCMMQRGVK
jgi:hypothetical protein